MPSKLQLKPPKKNQKPTIPKKKPTISETRKTRSLTKVQPDRIQQQSISSIFKKIVKESKPGGGEQLPQAEPQRDDQDNQSKTLARGLNITSRDISLQ